MCDEIAELDEEYILSSGVQSSENNDAKNSLAKDFDLTDRKISPEQNDKHQNSPNITEFGFQDAVLAQNLLENDSYKKKQFSQDNFHLKSSSEKIFELFGCEPIACEKMLKNKHSFNEEKNNNKKCKVEKNDFMDSESDKKEKSRNRVSYDEKITSFACEEIVKLDDNWPFKKNHPTPQGVKHDSKVRQFWSPVRFQAHRTKENNIHFSNHKSKNGKSFCVKTPEESSNFKAGFTSPVNYMRNLQYGLNAIAIKPQSNAVFGKRKNKNLNYVNTLNSKFKKKIQTSNGKNKNEDFETFKKQEVKQLVGQIPNKVLFGVECQKFDSLSISLKNEKKFSQSKEI